ncbi:MAG: hypothetical protein ABFC54_02125, partial [Thermoguttaceae bacterium]
MRNAGVLYLATILLSPCIFAAGCAWDFSAPKSKTPTVSQASDVGQVTVEKSPSESSKVPQKSQSLASDRGQADSVKQTSYEVAASDGSTAATHRKLNAVEPAVEEAP